MSQRHESPCPTCLTSPTRGMLPLGRADFVECPDCGGTGTFVCYEQRTTPARHFLMPGLRAHQGR